MIHPSTHASFFNHDDDAAAYDDDVRDEANPIRKGYANALSWLGAQVDCTSVVLDLGTGTGNAILALPRSCQVTGVDVSVKMLDIARRKLAGRSVTYVQSDILEYFGCSPVGGFDTIVSSYAIHHLTDEEKVLLFTHVARSLKANGKAVLVDLMYQNDLDKSLLIERYKENAEVTEAIREEFFWNVESARAELASLGFKITARRFSDLSWGILAEGVGPTMIPAAPRAGTGA